MNNYFRSFPDLHIIATDAIEVSNNCVISSQVVFSGRHNGLPFKVGNKPTLHPMGVRCVNDVEEYTFFMLKGKIAKIYIKSEGERSGPFGFYKQLQEGNDGILAF